MGSMEKKGPVLRTGRGIRRGTRIDQSLIRSRASSPGPRAMAVVRVMVAADGQHGRNVIALGTVRQSSGAPYGSGRRDAIARR